MRNALAIMLFALAGCAAPAEKAVGMPNPASVHCTELGGKVEIRRDAKGETGYCHLPDGRVIEEWELFRSKAKGEGE
jgi:putative hemolysin